MLSELEELLDVIAFLSTASYTLGTQGEFKSLTGESTLERAMATSCDGGHARRARGQRISTVLKIMRYVLMDVLRIVRSSATPLLPGRHRRPAAVRRQRAAVLLSLLDVVVLLIPLVTIVFGIVLTDGRAVQRTAPVPQPVARPHSSTDLFAGLVIPLSAAFVVGVSIPVSRTARPTP